jgi:DNA modification methylase
VPGPKDYLATLFEPVDEPNRLFYGDNLDVLREHVDDASVDLIYLDPPFNSNRNYNVIFAQHDIYDSSESAQIKAFDDTWHWTPNTGDQFRAAIAGGVPAKVADVLAAVRMLLGENDALAYLVNMAPRLVELHRVLKPTGSLYLHCDPTMSHYLKVMLDAIFGPKFFRNEVSWKRFSAKNDPHRFGRSHDTILFYTKGEKFTWNVQYGPFEEDYVEQNYRYVEEGTERRYRRGDLTANKPGGNVDYEWHGARPYKGRHWAYSRENMDKMLAEGRIEFRSTGMPVYKRYLDEQPGVPLQDIWTDIRLHSGSNERLGYPTQKPVALLERIIEASSNEGDLVLDPFCGCGTTIAGAQARNRRWIGIDITYIAVDLIENRLRHTFGAEITDGYVVDGIPRDLLGAKALFQKAPLDFERWAVSQVKGTPNEKQVGDKGADGVIRFFIDAQGNTGRALVSVKGGKVVGPHFVRDLLGTVETQKADMGVLITITKPTPGMKDAADHAGSYTWPATAQQFPKIQLFTVADLLSGKRPQMPPTLTPYIAAERLAPAAKQLMLELVG